MKIQKEIDHADKKYGDFNSTHEVYGVLMEEVEEFWELVKTNTIITDQIPEYKSAAMISELTQIVAIAQRAIYQLENNKIKHV